MLSSKHHLITKGLDLSANDDLEVKSRQTEPTFYPVPQAAGSQCDSRVYR